MNEDALPTRNWELSIAMWVVLGGVYNSYFSINPKRGEMKTGWRRHSSPRATKCSFEPWFFGGSKNQITRIYKWKVPPPKKSVPTFRVMKPIFSLWGCAIFFDLQMQPQYETMFEWFAWATKKKTLTLTFHYTGCSIGLLIVACGLL